MPIVAVGGIRMKSMFHRIRFQMLATRAFAQSRSAPGNLMTKVRPRDGMMFSLSVWDSRESMAQFAHSGAHKQALAETEWLSSWWHFHRYEADEIPTWDEAFAAWDAAVADRAA